MGKFIFDGPALTIEGDPSEVVGGIFQFDAVEVYRAWVDWTTQADNLKYTPAFSTAGGDPLGGGTFLGKFIFIRNDLGWRFVPPNTGTDIKVIITGNFYSSSDVDPVYVPWPGVATTIQSRVSQLTQLISVSTPVIEQADPAQIADEILAHPISGTVPGSIGEFIVKKLLSVAKFIGLK